MSTNRPTAEQAKDYVRETITKQICDDSAVVIHRAQPHPEYDDVMSVFFNIEGEDAALSRQQCQFDVWFEPLKGGTLYGEW